jgi:hypothetical protein
MALRAAMALVLSYAAPAFAHPLVERARESYAQGDFEAAAITLEAIGDDAGLSADDLVALLEIRALARRALGDDRGAEDALATLASLRPSHRFGPEVPPEVQDQFARLRGDRISIEARAHVANGELVVRARTTDPARLIRRVRIAVRAAGAWSEEDGTERRIATGSESTEWYAEAIGPGGAIVASFGSAGDPHVASGAIAVASGGFDPWPLIGITAGILAAGGIVLAIVLAFTAGTDTRVEGPVVMELFP